MQEGIDAANDKASDASDAFNSITSSLDSLLGGTIFSADTFKNAQSDLLRRYNSNDFSGDLSGTLSAATDFNTNDFSSETDYKRSFLKTSIMLTSMEGVAEGQLSSAELTVERLEEGLDDAERQHQLELRSNIDRLDALLGIDKSTLTVEEAIIDFKEQQEKALRANDLLEEQTYWMQSQYNALLEINVSVLTLSAAMRNVVSVQAASTTGGSFAEGTNYVPYDMTANIHKGEEITPARYVDVQWKSRDESTKAAKDMVYEIKQLRAEMRYQQKSIATTNKKTADVLEKWDYDGMPLEAT